jgi:BirA family biotin operon repressor/biotin-[acetyl-CoA-carboxylase] ligase
METHGATWLESSAAEGAANSRERWPAGWHVRTVEQTGSTNTDLLAAAQQGAPNRSVLAAAHQTSGRGRMERKWDAPPGTNLLVSLLFRELGGHPHEPLQRVGLAAAIAARQMTGLDVRLKWPNDLLVGESKLAGMLSQAGTVADPVLGRHRVDHVVVGIGINVGWTPEGGARLGDAVAPLDLLRHMLEAFDQLPADIHDLYRQNLATLGRWVRIEMPTGTISGRAIDVQRDGRLTVLDDCAISHHLDTGDIVHLRVQPEPG